MTPAHETTYQALDVIVADLWGSTLDFELNRPATPAMLADVARIALLALSHVSRHENVVRLYREVTAVADVLNHSPNPTLSECSVSGCERVGDPVSGGGFRCERHPWAKKA